MSKEKNNTAIAIVAALSFGGACYLGYKTFKLNALVDKLLFEVDKASSKMTDNIDVPDCVVAAAIKKASDRIAKDVATDCVDNIRNEYKAEIKNRVTNIINGEMANVKLDVKDAISKKIASIDIDDTKDEVVEKIVDRCEGKFKDTMNGFIDAYKDKLAWVMRLTDSTAIPVGNQGSKIELHF